MQFYCRHFETNDYTVFKFCLHINSSLVRLHAEFYDDTFLQYLFIIFHCQNTYIKIDGKLQGLHFKTYQSLQELLNLFSRPEISEFCTRATRLKIAGRANVCSYVLMQQCRTCLCTHTDVRNSFLLELIRPAFNLRVSRVLHLLHCTQNMLEVLQQARKCARGRPRSTDRAVRGLLDGPGEVSIATIDGAVSGGTAGVVLRTRPAAFFRYSPSRSELTSALRTRICTALVAGNVPFRPRSEFRAWSPHFRCSLLRLPAIQTTVVFYQHAGVTFEFPSLSFGQITPYYFVLPYL